MTEREFLVLLGDSPSLSHLTDTLADFLCAKGWDDMARKVANELDAIAEYRIEREW